MYVPTSTSASGPGERSRGAPQSRALPPCPPPWSPSPSAPSARRWRLPYLKHRGDTGVRCVSSYVCYFGGGGGGADLKRQRADPPPPEPRDASPPVKLKGPEAVLTPPLPTPPSKSEPGTRPPRRCPPTGPKPASVRKGREDVSGDRHDRPRPTYRLLESGLSVAGVPRGRGEGDPGIGPSRAPETGPV